METIKYNDTLVKINKLGAELKAYNVNNKDYIWNSDPKYWRRSAPFLFPVVGSLKNKQTTIDGVIYPLSQHGFLRDQEFKVIKKGNNYIVLENQYNDETLKLYPFKYKAQIKYEVINHSLTTSIIITNLGKEEMPFNIGGHPAFNVPLYENESFSDYKIIFEKEENIHSPKVCDGGLLDFNTIVYQKDDTKELNLTKDIFTIDTILIRDVNSRKVQLVNKDNKGIEFSYNGFNTLAIWTPFNDAPFICLEPWKGYNDLIDSDGDYKKKRDLIKLKENESHLVSYTINILS